ncbi:putative ATPase [Novosphingobium sp. PhB55]|uniref:ATP-binding protein n=1 Tax=Novosphingobium sp. PhB55 TaxID=2485106 RepID=UPI0010EF798A|nr:winged helix-turn-helix domain-containing protein [Novosphingobium sp. PhB55]TDW61879.1 putative ATPase [Novosphingobium sp. PhB55]
MADQDNPAFGEQMVFGPFCLSPGARLLTRDGQPVEIGGRSFDLLVALAEQPGRVLSKRELLRRVWPDVVVEDGSLRFHMAGLRKILGEGGKAGDGGGAGEGDQGGGARYIATQVGVGYAFVAPVERPAEAGSPPDVTTPKVAEGFTTNIPPPLPHLIGRERDVELLLNRVVDTPIFTIAGPAGVGKTSLMVEIGHRLTARFAGDAAFVDFGMLENPSLVPPMIAGAMGISVHSGDPAAVILGHLRDRPFLLLLDNCEHVVEQAAEIVERITEAAPQVRIVTTSREPLRVRGEHVHRLDALDYPEDPEGMTRAQLLAYPAVQLFCERARAADSALEIDAEDARLIAGMCLRLDGMALPIELAAVRVAAHGVAATARQIGERFSLAWAGRRTAQPRQQTLRAALDWSYDLLSPAERTVLDRLSVFVGPFSIDAAIYVVSDAALGSDEVAASFDELTAKSLISPNRLRGTGTYRLLEMTRAYAKEKLAGRGPEELRATTRRHAAFFLTELEAIAAQDAAAFQDPRSFRPQLGNIRSALDWSFGPEGDLKLAVRLAAASLRVFLNLSHLVECRTWAARAIAALEPEQRGSAMELELQSALGIALMFTRGNSPEAGAALTRALDIGTGLEDRWGQLCTLARLHIFHERIGEYEVAMRHAERAVEIAEAIGEPEALAVAYSLSGISHHLAGYQTRARHDLERALAASPPSERSRTIAFGFDHRNRSTIALARTLWLSGEPMAARALAEQAVREAAGLDHPVTHCIALIWAFSVYLWMGEMALVDQTLAAFTDSAQVNALGPYIAAAGGFRGEVAVERGDHAAAVLALQESLSLLRAARYDLLTTPFSIALARGLAAEGRLQDARQVVDATIARCTANEERIALPELLRIKAAIVGAASADAAGAARALLEEARSLARDQGARAWELRAALDLAATLVQEGKAHEARALVEQARHDMSRPAQDRDLGRAETLLASLS